MDVIINNPAGGAVSALPTVQGYGPAYGYSPAYGPGQFGGHFNPLAGILFIVGAVLLVRFVLFRARRGPWAGRRFMAPQAGQAGAARDGAQDDQTQGPRWPFWDRQGGAQDSALNIARERFARSEISAEEYEAICKGLEGR